MMISCTIVTIVLFYFSVGCENQIVNTEESSETNCWTLSQYENSSRNPFNYFTVGDESHILIQMKAIKDSFPTDCYESENVHGTLFVSDGSHIPSTDERETTLHIIASNHVVPTKLEISKSNLTNCVELSRKLFSIGTNDGSSDEFLQDGFVTNHTFHVSTNDDLDYGEDCVSENDLTSNFPKEINMWSMTQHFIKFSAGGIDQGKISTGIGGILTIHLTRIIGTLRLRVSVRDEKLDAWIDLGIKSQSNSEVPVDFEFTVPDGTLSDGCHTNILLIDASESDDFTTGTYDYIEYEFREETDDITTEIFNNNEIFIHRTKVDFWWLQNSFSICIYTNNGLETCEHDITFLTISKTIPLSTESSEFLALYADGILKMKPFPEDDESTVPFGSSVILGHVQGDKRRYRKVKSVDIYVTRNENDLESLLIHYEEDDEQVRLDLVKIDREKIIMNAVSDFSFFQVQSNDNGFLQFRSMYVQDGISDCDSILYDDGIVHFSDDSNPQSIESTRIGFIRRCESIIIDNSKSPEFAFSLFLNNKSSETKSCTPECQNGGKCNEFGNCTCIGGYFGMVCSNFTCENDCGQHGKCIGAENCTCDEGYEGVECNHPICTPKCHHGMCESPNTCNCESSGYEGSSCEIPMCNPTCKNGGACTLPNICDCSKAFGFAGPTCNFKSCDVVCMNGFCDTTKGGCQCPLGWIGHDCSVPFCSSTCVGGTCVGPETCQIIDTQHDNTKYCHDYSDCPIKSPRCSDQRCSKCQSDDDCSKHSEDMNLETESLVCDDSTGKCKKCFDENSVVYVKLENTENSKISDHRIENVKKTRIKDLKIGDLVYTLQPSTIPESKKEETEEKGQDIEFIEVVDVIRHRTPGNINQVRYYIPETDEYGTLSITSNHMMYFLSSREYELRYLRNITISITPKMIFIDGPKQVGDMKEGDLIIVMEENLIRSDRKSKIGIVQSVSIKKKSVKLVNVFTKDYNLFVDGVFVTGFGNNWYGKWPSFVYTHLVYFLRVYVGVEAGGWFETKILKKLVVCDV